MTALTVAPSLSGAVLPLGLTGPRRVLMTLDAVGGVWRYAIDLASALVEQDYSFVFAGFGPAPDAAQRAEAEALGTLIWLDAPLDWTAQDETELDPISGLIADLVEARDIDLVHLNLPSQ